MIPETMEELERVRQECQAMVNKRAATSAAGAVVPVLGADIGVDISIMLELLPTINRKFGLTPEQIDDLDTTVKGQLIVIMTSLGSKLVGKVITKTTIALLLKTVGKKIAVKQVAKFIPFIGQAVAAGISFGAMKHLGNSHIDECYEVCRHLIAEQNESEQ